MEDESCVTPLTWTFVKLLGSQLRRWVCDWNGLPNSHALASRSLLTKAQIVGVLVSIQQRAERVELQIDDGTALLRAVVWTNSWAKDITLGDLVRIEGKFNTDNGHLQGNFNDSTYVEFEHEHGRSPELNCRSFTELIPSVSARELRVLRLSKMRDPNEEPLHWLHVQNLTHEFYNIDCAMAEFNGQDKSATESFNNRTKLTPLASIACTEMTARSKWDRIVNRIFREQILADDEVDAFRNRLDKSPHDDMVLEVLHYLIQGQRSVRTDAASSNNMDAAFRVCFPDILRDKLANENVVKFAVPHHPITRSLRHAFVMLRSSGLLYLEDVEKDRYVFLTAQFALNPALINFLRSKEEGASIADIADWVLGQERFSRLPMESLYCSLRILLETKQIEEKDDPRKFFSVP